MVLKVQLKVLKSMMEARTVSTLECVANSHIDDLVPI